MNLRESRTAGYESPRLDVVAHVPPTASRILDIGCSTGALGAAIKARQPARVVGVDVVPEYVLEARERLDRAECMDARMFVDHHLGGERFDCIVCADVLEHLIDPWALVAAAVEHLDQGGVVVISVPNVLWFQNALRLLRERRWPREDQNIFDRTHLRWFSLADAHELLVAAGIEVIETEFRFWDSRRWLVPTLRFMTRTRFATFAAAQHIVVGRKT
jgi:2-polyprenyl-3-methyl-5-hydroxy-6-metoxy-1,4-benzoquinol methylase